jgi:hypothetical protein
MLSDGRQIGSIGEVPKAPDLMSFQILRRRIVMICAILNVAAVAIGETECERQAPSLVGDSNSNNSCNMSIAILLNGASGSLHDLRRGRASSGSKSSWLRTRPAGDVGCEPQCGTIK